MYLLFTLIACVLSFASGYAISLSRNKEYKPIDASTKRANKSILRTIKEIDDKILQSIEEKKFSAEISTYSMNFGGRDYWDDGFIEFIKIHYETNGFDVVVGSNVTSMGYTSAFRTMTITWKGVDVFDSSHGLITSK